MFYSLSYIKRFFDRGFDKLIKNFCPSATIHAKDLGLIMVFEIIIQLNKPLLSSFNNET